MTRAVLIALFSFLLVHFVTPAAQAKDISAPIAKNKKLSRSAIALQRKSAGKIARKKIRSTAAQRSKATARAIKKRIKKPVATTRKRKSANRQLGRSRTALNKRSSNSLKLQKSISLASYPVALRSNVAYVIDQSSDEVLYAKNSSASLPIASLTKLMTALVVVEARQNMKEMLKVTTEDIDKIKYTSSRLPIGSRLSRSNMLHIALMSSENRAASALGRNFPGGLPAFVKAMNGKAKILGMTDTHFVEPTGLSSQNVSSARDLAKLVIAAHKHSVIRKYSTNKNYQVDTGGPVLQYRNSNRLISNPTWDIVLQKTGYISEAGRCLVMQAIIKGRSIVMVLLDSKGKYSRAADASSIRKWLEDTKIPAMVRADNAAQG